MHESLSLVLCIKKQFPLNIVIELYIQQKYIQKAVNPKWTKTKCIYIYILDLSKKMNCLESSLRARFGVVFAGKMSSVRKKRKKKLPLNILLNITVKMEIFD